MQLEVLAYNGIEKGFRIAAENFHFVDATRSNFKTLPRALIGRKPQKFNAGILDRRLICSGHEFGLLYESHYWIGMYVAIERWASRDLREPDRRHQQQAYECSEQHSDIVAVLRLRGPEYRSFRLMSSYPISFQRYNAGMSSGIFQYPQSVSELLPTALTIAGSDPSGGAGIQADLKVFSALRVYGMAVVTALTAQNTEGVREVYPLPEGALAGQLDAVLSDIPPIAVKIGMLSTLDNVEIVQQKLSEYECRWVILDPVITSSSGATLLDSDARHILSTQLLPMCTLVTPNLNEAEALFCKPVRTPFEMETAARGIYDLAGANVLVTGGHLEGVTALDVFFDGKNMERLAGERIDDAASHGTGCVLSAAIAAHLARGQNLLNAVEKGKAFTANAIRNRLQLGRGPGPCDPLNLGGA
jgi:hydroxymethylpyrimidine/phosphomethylpyrimidine kinase